jgi:hypothetical protein
MGKTVTPKYALDVYTNKLVDGRWQNVKTDLAFCWDIKSYGRPTEENLEKYVKALAKSFEHGGVNHQTSVDLGYIPYPTKAVIRFNHAHGATVAEWTAAPFQVW